MRSVLVLFAALALSLPACTATEGTLSHDLLAAVHPPDLTKGFSTGTGFFVSFDGTLVTAKHVVRQCLRIDIMSEAVAPTAVSMIASYDDWDLALLRVSGAFSTPAALRIGTRAPAPSERLMVYGYPLGAGIRRASMADARLASEPGAAAFLKAITDAKPLDPATRAAMARTTADPGIFVWLDAPLAQGYSGGPVIDQDGAVVGVIRGMTKDPTPARYFFAMGTKPVAWLTRNTVFVPPTVNPASSESRDDEAARSAIVRVICWHDNAGSKNPN